MFARGIPLPRIGSVEDRVMREMVFRERIEKVAAVKAVAAIVARVLNADLDKAFGSILGDYASEVFQESYDPTALARKLDYLREAQARVHKRRAEDRRALQRLERMEQLGEEFETKSREKAVRKGLARPAK